MKRLVERLLLGRPVSHARQRSCFLPPDWPGPPGGRGRGAGRTRRGRRNRRRCRCRHRCVSISAEVERGDKEEAEGAREGERERDMFIHGGPEFDWRGLETSQQRDSRQMLLIFAKLLKICILMRLENWSCDCSGGRRGRKGRVLNKQNYSVGKGW